MYRKDSTGYCGIQEDKMLPTSSILHIALKLLIPKCGFAIIPSTKLY